MPPRSMIEENGWNSLEFWNSFNLWNIDQQMRLMAFYISDSQPVELVTGVYIGSVGASINRPVLKDLGITHILGVAYGLKPMFHDDFDNLYIPLKDDMTANI